MEFQFGQFRAAVPDVFLHNTSPTPSPFPGMGSKGVGRGHTREEQNTDKALMLYQHCSAIAKALLCYKGCLGYKCQTLHHTSCSEEH